MKFVLIMISLIGISTSSFACPDLTIDSKIYTELELGCHNGLPDFSQPAAVNQADGHGAECRIVLKAGESFRVNGLNVEIAKQNQQSQLVGVLHEWPSCSQTDTGHEAESVWVSVELLTPAVCGEMRENLADAQHAVDNYPARNDRPGTPSWIEVQSRLQEAQAAAAVACK